MTSDQKIAGLAPALPAHVLKYPWGKTLTPTMLLVVFGWQQCFAAG